MNNLIRACIVRSLGAAALLALLVHGGVRPDSRSYAAGTGGAKVNYSRNADQTYTFQFVDPDGNVTTRSYRPEGQ